MKKPGSQKQKLDKTETLWVQNELEAPPTSIETTDCNTGYGNNTVGGPSPCENSCHRKNPTSPMVNLVLKKKMNHQSTNDPALSISAPAEMPASAASRSSLAWTSGWSHVSSLGKREVTILYFHFRPSNYWVVSTHLRKKFSKNPAQIVHWFSCGSDPPKKKNNPIFTKFMPKLKMYSNWGKIPDTVPTYWLTWTL